MPDDDACGRSRMVHGEEWDGERQRRGWKEFFALTTVTFPLHDDDAALSANYQISLPLEIRIFHT